MLDNHQLDSELRRFRPERKVSIPVNLLPLELQEQHEIIQRRRMELKVMEHDFRRQLQAYFTR